MLRKMLFLVLLLPGVGGCIWPGSRRSVYEEGGWGYEEGVTKCAKGAMKSAGAATKSAEGESAAVGGSTAAAIVRRRGSVRGRFIPLDLGCSACPRARRGGPVEARGLHRVKGAPPVPPLRPVRPPNEVVAASSRS